MPDLSTIPKIIQAIENIGGSVRFDDTYEDHLRVNYEFSSDQGWLNFVKVDRRTNTREVVNGLRNLYERILFKITRQPE
jgi:hypothetical protein